jgi:hypothetical protein
MIENGATIKEQKPRNPNPLFGFFEAMYNRSGEILNGHKRRMPTMCILAHQCVLQFMQPL